MTSSLFYISKAVKEGPLKKKSPHKLGQVKWSNRYVVLYEDALVYYQSKDAPKPRGVVPLQYVITSSVISDADVPQKSGKLEVPLNSRFEVAIRCTPSMKVFHWAASSEQEAAAWVQEIKRVSELVKAAQARDPYEAFCGPPSPGFWKDVVGLGVARARAAKEKAKTVAEEKIPLVAAGIGSPRAPRSASVFQVFDPFSAPHSGALVPRDSEDEENNPRESGNGVELYAPLVNGGVMKLGPLSPEPQTPVLVGLLSKRSPRGLKLWQRRYFSLFPDLLIYSKSEGTPVLGAVPLECVENVPIIEITEGASLFNIVINHKGNSTLKTLEIMASTPQECTMWVEALHHMCPNTMYHKKQASAPTAPRSRNSSVAGMIRPGSSGVIEFDLSTPYVDKSGPDAPSRVPSVPKVPAPPPSPLVDNSSPVNDSATAGPDKLPPKAPPRKLSTYGSFAHMHTPAAPTLYTALTVQDQKPRALSTKDAPQRAPPPPPSFRKTVSSSAAPTIIDDVFPSPFTPIAAPIFAPVKHKASDAGAPPPPKQEAPRVAPVLTSAALPDPMDEAPPDYTSSSDDDNSEVSPRESVNFAAICTPESITTVTTYYRSKTTDSSDSEDYVLIDLDGASDDGEEKIPAFLPQIAPAKRKTDSISWTAIHHSPAEYSPKLATTKLSPDTVDRDLILSQGPSRWRSNTQKDPSPPPRSSTPPAATHHNGPPSPTQSRVQKADFLATSDYPNSILYHVDGTKPRSPTKTVPPPPSKIPEPRILSAEHKPPNAESKPLSAEPTSPKELKEALKPGEGQGKEGISVGDYVELGGLTTSKYNNQRGVVIYVELNRCEIRLASGDVVRIKEVNLKKIPKPKVTAQHRSSASFTDSSTPKHNAGTGASQTDLAAARRGSGSGSGSGASRPFTRQQSQPKLRGDSKFQTAPSRIPKLGDHKRALSTPSKSKSLTPMDTAEVPKPFLADEDGTGTEDDDTEDEQPAAVQSAPDWVRDRIYSSVSEKSPSQASNSKTGLKDKLLKR